MRFQLFYAALLSARSVAQSPVSASVFSQIQRYTLFAAASYSENCVTPPAGSKIVKFFNDTATDTQAYLFQAGTERILSFRGSSSPKDLDTDLNFTLTDVILPDVACDGCSIHTGFQQAVLSILPAIRSSLNGVPSSSLTITGHSLGGALAAVAATVLKPSKVFTFGEPRNGNPAWSATVDAIIKPANYFRVTHFNDGVPQIPPTSLGFQHHGTEYWESLRSGNTAASTKKCLGVEPANCNKAQDFGATPINKAHIVYTDEVVASMLYNPGCGYQKP